MNSLSFWEQLKRRNVPRVAAFYAGSAWLLVQVATQVFPFFDVPNWAVRLVVIAAFLGFPFVIAFSWFYELTPLGLKRESEMAADASIPRSSGRRLDRWIIAVLSLAVVVLLASLFVRGGKPQPQKADADKSIAVLPFESLSDDKSNAYFALGIQDEILTRLSKIGGLRVISRTSTARYASNPDDLPDIAKRLGVAHVLEGSVQKSGDTVRINVQLIHAATDQHLWAEIYDRKLDNMFSVEGEVAQAIAEALNTRLTSNEHAAMNAAPTRNAAAYDLYLRGLNSELRYTSQQDYFDAERYYREAVRADPAFALAWAHLAMTQSYLYLNGTVRTGQYLADLRNSAETAMKLQPELGEAWLARGYYYYRGLGDFDAAIGAFQQASQRLPNSAEVSAAIAYVQRRQGKWDEALANLMISARRDPQNISYWTGLAEIHSALGRYSQAQSTLDHVLEISPERAVTLKATKANYYQDAGDLDAAQKILDSLPPDDPSLATLFGRQWLYRRDYAPIAPKLEKLLADPEAQPGDDRPSIYSLLGASYFFSGHPDPARAAFAEGRRLALELRKSGVDSFSLSCNLGVNEAALGHRDAALAEARHCVELVGNDHWERPFAETAQTQVQVLVGDREAALAVLPSLVETPNGVRAGDLRYSPVWDTLRDDARFKAVLARVDTPARQ
ncbi:MAG: tetratricopeptide repeat protein [Hydrocarboniphaga sp.]|uniref:tetratricopeptide repeat protein n=1 Tax=Hydrocarboniphaga sp. TaxID=2033016 RepID=UPI00261D4EC5|nr:tetratricopeptide repeat protein [Hydrocarboniphaga sp.]MDB5968772.1 tetratricopeptide repeat protein [Hydrocarboniphaga sp.]